MEKKCIIKKKKGNPTSEYTSTPSWGREDFWWSTLNGSSTEWESLTKCISISDHFNFVSLHMENHRVVKEFNPSSRLSGFFSQVTCSSESPKQQASYNFLWDTILTLNLFIYSLKVFHEVCPQCSFPLLNRNPPFSAFIPFGYLQIPTFLSMLIPSTFPHNISPQCSLNPFQFFSITAGTRLISLILE